MSDLLSIINQICRDSNRPWDFLYHSRLDRIDWSGSMGLKDHAVRCYQVAGFDEMQSLSLRAIHTIGYLTQEPDLMSTFVLTSSDFARNAAFGLHYECLMVITEKRIAHLKRSWRRWILKKSRVMVKTAPFPNWGLRIWTCQKVGDLSGAYVVGHRQVLSCLTTIHFRWADQPPAHWYHRMVDHFLKNSKKTVLYYSHRYFLIIISTCDLWAGSRCLIEYQGNYQDYK